MRQRLLIGETTFIAADEAFGEDVRGVNERPNALRVGAFDPDDRLIGFSFGWQQGEGRFYQAGSQRSTFRRGPWSRESWRAP